MKWYYRKKPSKSWVKWRTKVYERDSYHCILCGKRNKVMNPHHILPKALFPKLKFYVSNGATLCKRCHRKTFGKELLFVVTIVQKLFGEMTKWKLRKHWVKRVAPCRCPNTD